MNGQPLTTALDPQAVALCLAAFIERDRLRAQVAAMTPEIVALRADHDALKAQAEEPSETKPPPNQTK